jgi:exopolysaccharide biosynthesis protein
VPFPGPLLLLDGGVNKACKDCDSVPVETVAARTAVGVGSDDNFLYLLTIDGGGANTGASFYDVAAWLRVLGAWRGRNLDGGGSTTMVMQDPETPDYVWIVNNP